ncbi:MAG: hypothetical protein A2600_12040 [Candidatus Lambdaproteobacteria bacterium RIFOXYD1_FULL_56_27]|uniref:Thioesterase domain-containing protein n=1 Tax=Candidatus Lambdaproteobacteria bacterium RIFOXYD2_FULL_56_26 TaxID=1817773 RepID=A0A1F6GX26_9PROT|nr:MAG: hypothetical protein A2426_08905 [Candidatus Lambdaproteobacteria bacterium RIFOXYC1_FULL_56_13]OGH02715.1 MAG: hypothetical protein A2557_11505 [Candidatus Lambdaproteobacteria bacterium RIFOXYD2_FULL_56_26]OGH07993.1 MAG: hypothetical protein A2600_12040 [Candidatus Lambdaproteobacteria bacterium RIFOXYD1_FULL_56_27]
MKPIGNPLTIFQLEVRYNETDLMGVVYHSNYFSWFHLAREQLMKAAGARVAETEHRGIHLPVIEACCHYRAAAKYGDRLEIRVFVHPKSLALRPHFNYEIQKEGIGRAIAYGQTKHVWSNHQGQLLTGLPEAYQSLGSCFDGRNSTCK